MPVRRHPVGAGGDGRKHRDAGCRCLDRRRRSGLGHGFRDGCRLGLGRRRRPAAQQHRAWRQGDHDAIRIGRCRRRCGGRGRHAGQLRAHRDRPLPGRRRRGRTGRDGLSGRARCGVPLRGSGAAGAEDQRERRLGGQEGGPVRGGFRLGEGVFAMAVVGPRIFPIVASVVASVILPVGGTRRLVEAHEAIEEVDRPRRQRAQVRDVEGHRHEALHRDGLGAGSRPRVVGVPFRGGAFRAGRLRLERGPVLHGRPFGRGPRGRVEPRLHLGPVRQVGPVAGRLLGRHGDGRDDRRRGGELDRGPRRAAVRRAEIAHARGGDEGLAPERQDGGLRAGAPRLGDRGLRRGYFGTGDLSLRCTLPGSELLGGALGLDGQGLGAGPLQGDALGLQRTLATLLQDRVGSAGVAHGRRGGGHGRGDHRRGDHRRGDHRRDERRSGGEGYPLRRDRGRPARLAHEQAGRGGALIDAALEDRVFAGIDAYPVVEDVRRPASGAGRGRGVQLALAAFAAEHRGGRGQPARLGAAGEAAGGRARGAGRRAGQATGEAGAQRHQPMRQGSEGEARALAPADGAGGITVGIGRPSRSAHGYSERREKRGSAGARRQSRVRPFVVNRGLNEAPRARTAHTMRWRFRVVDGCV